MPTWLMIAGGVVLALAAFLAIGWLVERRERRAYVKTLDQAGRERLSAWESVNSDWRAFRDSELLDRQMATDDAARLRTFAAEYNAGRA